MQVADLKSLFTGEEKGVSPVIGVILMVAVTVILAAVIGAFVMNMGDNLSQSAPQANFNYEYDAQADNLQITHDGGDSFTDKNSQQVAVNVDGTTVDFNQSSSATDYWVQDASGDPAQSYPVSAGDTVTIGDGGTNGDDATVDTSGQEVRVIWTSDSGDSTQTVGSYTIP